MQKYCDNIFPLSYSIRRSVARHNENENFSTSIIDTVRVHLDRSFAKRWQANDMGAQKKIVQSALGNCGKHVRAPKMAQIVP